MKEIGYTIRSGITKNGKDQKEETYLTFYFTDADGKVHRRRNYNLLPGTEEYSIQNIKAKIEDKSRMKEPHYETVASILERKAGLYLRNKAYMKGSRTFNRLYQAVGYYRLPNPFSVPPYQVRKDIMRLDKLIEECAYIKRNPSNGIRELESRAEKVDGNLKSLYIRRKALKKMEEDFRMVVPEEDAYKYMHLKKQLLNTGDADDKWEILEDEIEKMEEHLPAAYIYNAEELLDCEVKIEAAKNEKRILGRVIKMEGGNQGTYVALEKTKPGVPKI